MKGFSGNINKAISAATSAVTKNAGKLDVNSIVSGAKKLAGGNFNDILSKAGEIPNIDIGNVENMINSAANVGGENITKKFEEIKSTISSMTSGSDN